MRDSSVPLGSRFLMLFCLLIVTGCAGLGGSRGDRLLGDGRYDAAVAEYERQIAAGAAGGRTLRNYGAALYFAGRPEDATTRLQEAIFADALDLKARYFLARAYDDLGRSEDALRAYGAYLELGGEFSAPVRGRMETLIRERAARDIRVALAREDSLSAAPPPENTLAVPEFSNVTGTETMEALAHGLAALLITDLAKVERIRVLERGALETIRSELRMAGVEASPAVTPADSAAAMGSASTRLVDPATAPRVGRLLRVRRFVQGHVVPLGETGVQMSAGIVDAVDGAETPAGDALNGELGESLRMAKRLAYQILAALGVEPSREEREAIDVLATGNLDALLAFGRGLVQERRGLTDAALASHREALRIDPGFVEAAAAEAYLNERERDLAAADDAYADEAWDESDPGDPRRFLNRLVVSVGSGPPPDDIPGGGGDGGGGGSGDDGADLPNGDADDDGFDITPIEIDKVSPPLPDFPDPPGAPARRGGGR